MYVIKQRINRIWQCTNFFIRKSLSRPANIIFAFILPLVWMILMTLVTRNSFAQFEILQMNYIGLVCISSALCFPITALTLMTLPHNIAIDRINKRLKMYHILQVNKYDYILSNLFFCFAIYISSSLIQLICFNFIFSISLSFSAFLLIIFVQFCIFISTFILGLFISTLPKTEKSINPIISLFFYTLFLFSNIDFAELLMLIFKISHKNISLPVHYLVKSVNFLSPTNSGAYFIKNIIIADVEQTNYSNWNVDWICLVWHFIVLVVIIFFTYKRFNWK